MYNFRETVEVSQARILIVEDEALIAENLGSKLVQLGYEVTGIVGRSEEAIASALQLRPQLILMDIMLGGRKDGIQAAETIRERLDVPIIYLTAHSDPGTLARAKITEPFGYILKPFELRDLAIQIELALYKYHADRQVREQREWLRVTLASVGDAVIATDADGAITFMNPVAVSLTGWEAEEAIGRPVQEIFRVINEETRSALDDPVNKVIRGGKIVGLANHTLLVRRGGGEVPIDDSGAPIIDAKGHIRGVVLVFRDVTERRKAEKRRQQHEQRLAHINQVLKAIRSVNQLITYEKHRDTLLRRACEILVEMRSYAAAWIALRDDDGKLQAVAESGVGHAFASLGAEFNLGRIPVCCQKALTIPHDVAIVQGTTVNCDGCPLADAEDSGTSSMAGALRHEDREFGVLVVVLSEGMVDLEDEQSLFRELIDDLGFALYGIDQEEKRRWAEARYKVLFESSSDGILITDIETRRVRYANPALCRFFGYSETEFESLQVTDIHPKQDLSKIMSGFEAQIRGDLTLAPDVPCLRKDGSVVFADINAVPIEIDGRTFLAGFFRDITARKAAELEHERLQAQLIQAQKMESVGRLAGGVAHDYNNILSVILGYAELALQRDDLSEDLRGDLREIYSAAIRSRDITKQLLAFARKQTIDPDVLDLNVTIEGMLKILRRLIGEDIDLAWLPGQGLWPVLIDPSQINQILANLCINARDAISDVGKVTIETSKATIDQEYCRDHAEFLPGDFVVLTVSDNGCGMDQNTLGRIFEPFYTTKGVGKGTGLGLATVYGIAKQNDGFINVYSEPDEGTTFRIYLPRHTGDILENGLENKAKTAVGKKEWLLVVEDDVSILKFAERILRGLNYNVLIAKSPSEALHLARTHYTSIDLLITDVVMPEMNGRELAEQLQATLDPGLKCLYMSGYTANVIAHRGVLDKGFRFIQKPFSTKDLAEKVRAALDDAD